MLVAFLQSFWTRVSREADLIASARTKYAAKPWALRITTWNCALAGDSGGTET